MQPATSAKPVPSPDDAGRVTVRPHPHDHKLFRLQTELLLPAPRDNVFEFFSDARQLETLTPPWIRFQIVTPLPIAMHPGALIDYKLRIRGLPVRWRSVISIWEPPVRFVDQQVCGPYRCWRHEHGFESHHSGGTVVRDTIDYRVPGGRLINRLFVQPDVERIFRYRLAKLKELFG
jgi:ligand-binding SRPBCC domain-containing protein